MPEKNSAVKPITQKRLTNIALYYLGRYESSAENLRRILQRRVSKAVLKGADVSSEASVWINAVVLEMCRLGYVNDERFAASTVEKYRAAGKSERYIRLKLAQAGIDSDLQEGLLKKDDGRSAAEIEFEAACRLVKKKKLGLYRSEDQRKLCRKKDLAALARAGFSFQTAVKALGKNDDDEGDEYAYD